MKKIFAIAIIVISAGCSTVEVLPGLCYTDKDGTFLCPTPKNDGEPEIIREIDNLFEQCQGLAGTTAWHWCIDMNRLSIDMRNTA